MLLRLWVSILLRHTKIHHVNNVLGLRIRATNEKIVRFDVAVYQVLFMDSLYSGQHLLRNHDDRLDGELAVAHVKQVFQRGSEQIYDEDVVQPFLAKVVDIRNAS